MAMSPKDFSAEYPMDRQRVNAHKERLLEPVGGGLAIEFVLGDQRLHMESCRIIECLAWRP